MHHLQAMLGHPSRKYFEGMVHANLIANHPRTPQKISLSHQLFGENLAGLRGNTVQNKTKQMRIDFVQIPRDLIKLNKYMMLTVDIMFVNILAFVIKYGRGITLIMAEFIPNQMANQ